jgi:multiple antibiotic resistance protein
MTFLSAFFLLVLVMDGLGDIPLFLSALRNVSRERWTRVILREMGFAFAILVVFLFAGRWLLMALQVSERSLTIAGGIILFLIALRMIFPAATPQQEEASEGEPYLVPLAIPYVAGPSAISTVMLIMSREPGRWLEWLGALALASLVTCGLLLLSPWVHRALGERGVRAIERLMGLVLTAIATEMLLKGIGQFVQSVVQG